MMRERVSRHAVALAAVAALLAGCQAEASFIATPTTADELLVERAASVVTPTPALPTPIPLPTPTPTPGPTPTPTPTATPAPTATATAFERSVENVTCEAIGVDSFNDIQLLVSLRGIDRLADMLLDVELLDGGSSLGRPSIYLSGVGPNEEVLVVEDTFVDLPEGVPAESIDCRPRILDWFEPLALVEHESECVARIADDGRPGVRISSTIRGGSFSSTVQVRFAVRTASGVRFAGGFLVVHGVEGRVQIDMAGGTPNPVPDALDVEAMECSVVYVERDFSLFGGPVEELRGATSCEILGLDEFGRVQIQASADVPNIEEGGRNLIWSAYRADGVMVMSDKRGINASDGQDGVYVLDSWEEPPEWLDLDELTCRLVGVDA